MISVFAEQPTLAECRVDPAPDPLLARLVSPPLTREQADGVDLILEGFLLHHGRPRLLEVADSGRRILAGDFCYARGLVAVAESGDLYVIEALADLVALSAALVAQGAHGDLPALWRSTLAAVAHEDPVLRNAVTVATRELRTGDATALRAIAATLEPMPELTEALA